jgi:hypothetical protein
MTLNAAIEHRAPEHQRKRQDVMSKQRNTFWVIVNKSLTLFSTLVLWCSVSYPLRFLG